MSSDSRHASSAATWAWTSSTPWLHDVRAATSTRTTWPPPRSCSRGHAACGLVSDAEAERSPPRGGRTAGADEQALRAVWEIREATVRRPRAALSAGADGAGGHARRARSAVPALDRGARPRLAGSGRCAAPTARRPSRGRPSARTIRGWPGSGTARCRPGSSPDRLAAACVELVQSRRRAPTEGLPAGPGRSGWLFVDRSRNGSRRWCTMDDCGAHAKARRLTGPRRQGATSESLSRLRRRRSAVPGEAVDDRHPPAQASPARWSADRRSAVRS